MLDRFIQKYIPNNHWLTKSMEFLKLEYGTYWHLKKMIVYYYYLFVLNKFEIAEIKAIIANFESFILSIDDKFRIEAEKFFFATDIRKNDTFITPQEFFYTPKLDVTKSDKLMAKKFYYLYLMNKSPESENQPQYKIYTSCLKERNFFKGIEKIKNEIISEYGEGVLQRYIGDTVSQLRNERKILNLFGLLNSSYPSDAERCSPTEIGLACINSNLNEFILFMEIQKIKQVSRNPLTFYNVSNRARDRKFNSSADFSSLLNEFNIRRHPYYVFLKFLYEKKTISTDDFRYILARTSDNNSMEEIIALIDININDIKNKVREKDREFIIPGNNNRSADYIGSEDFSKEFKKYFYGIVNSNFDGEANLFGVAKYINGKVELVDEDKLLKLLNIYDMIFDFLDAEYLSVFDLARELQKDKFMYMASNRAYDESSLRQIEISKEWIYYYFSLNSKIVQMMMAGICTACKLTDNEILEKFPYIIKKYLAIKSKKNLVTSIIDATNIEIEQQYEFIVPNEITISMLIDESKKYLDKMSLLTDSRKRNTRIIDLYSNWAIQNNNNHCEMCGLGLLPNGRGGYISDVHHLIPFNENQAFGPDDYRNLINVCPTCHRVLHKSMNRNDYENNKNKINENSYLKMTLKNRILEMYKEGYLYPSGLLYALEHAYITQSEYDEIISS